MKNTHDSMMDRSTTNKRWPKIKFNVNTVKKYIDGGRLKRKHQWWCTLKYTSMLVDFKKYINSGGLQK